MQGARPDPQIPRPGTLDYGSPLGARFAEVGLPVGGRGPSLAPGKGLPPAAAARIGGGARGACPRMIGSPLAPPLPLLVLTFLPRPACDPTVSSWWCEPAGDPRDIMVAYWRQAGLR